MKTLRHMSNNELQTYLEEARQEHGLACDLAKDPSQPRGVRENARKKRRAAGRKIDRGLNEQKRRRRGALYDYKKELRSVANQ